MYVPPKVLTNFDLEKMVDTTDEWIRTRTGIRERHRAGLDRLQQTAPGVHVDDELVHHRERLVALVDHEHGPLSPVLQVRAGDNRGDFDEAVLRRA